MINDSIKMKGELTIKLYDVDGKLKEEHELKNLVVQVGKNFITSRMVDTTQAVMSAMAVGSGNVAPTSSDTLLGAEFARTALASSVYNANVITYTATFAPGVGTGAITEAGIFNSTTANTGTMLSRTTFSVVNKGSADTLTITWNITVQ